MSLISEAKFASQVETLVRAAEMACIFMERLKRENTLNPYGESVLLYLRKSIKGIIPEEDDSNPPAGT